MPPPRRVLSHLTRAEQRGGRLHLLVRQAPQAVAQRRDRRAAAFFSSSLLCGDKGGKVRWSRTIETHQNRPLKYQSILLHFQPTQWAGARTHSIWGPSPTFFLCVATVQKRARETGPRCSSGPLQNLYLHDQLSWPTSAAFRRVNRNSFPPTPFPPPERRTSGALPGCRVHQLEREARFRLVFGQEPPPFAF